MIYYNDQIKEMWFNPDTGQTVYYIKEYCPLCKHVTIHFHNPSFELVKGAYTEKKVCTEHSWADERDKEELAKLTRLQNMLKHIPEPEYMEFLQECMRDGWRFYNVSNTRRRGPRSITQSI